MYRIGLSSCSKALDERFFISCADAGIRAVEVSPRYDEHFSLDLREIKGFADTHGVELWSYHLPFLPFEKLDPSSLDASVRKNTLETFERLISRGVEAGIDLYIVHPSGEPVDACERQDKLKYSRETLITLAGLASGYGATVAVEDLPRTCLGNCSGEISYLTDGTELKVCFDTNHLLFESASDFIRRIGSRIVTLHVSDFDFVNERHWLPGEGKQDWSAILDGLNGIGYGGVWMYELGFDCPPTLKRSRELNCRDFYENAQKLFSKQTPNRI